MLPVVSAVAVGCRVWQPAAAKASKTSVSGAKARAGGRQAMISSNPASTRAAGRPSNNPLTLIGG